MLSAHLVVHEPNIVQSVNGVARAQFVLVVLVGIYRANKRGSSLLRIHHTVHRGVYESSDVALLKIIIVK